MNNSIALLMLFVPAISLAVVPPMYQKISSNYEIPSEVLYSIAMQESMPPRNFIKGINKPWPWTLNCNGEGHYFATKKNAIDFASLSITAGKNCDLGLMQISWKWHKQRFDSIHDALDPYINIKIGAEILKEQFNKSGSWEHAVGAYHSPSNSKRAAIYRENVRNKLAKIRGIKF